MTKLILTIALILTSVSTVQAKDKSINVNTKPVVVYEEAFTVYCEHGKKETVCVEVITSGENKGNRTVYTFPASVLASE